MPEAAPFGSWKSPITATAIAESAVTLGGVVASAGSLWWLEQRAAEGGRGVVVRDGTDVTPDGFNVRTAVHEYGGGAWWIHGTTVYFTNWSDQRLYRQDEGAEPVAITPEPEIPRGLRYADGVVAADGRAIICIRERHVEGREAFNEIVVLPTDGSAEPGDIISGNDFYANPRLSPDGKKLSWTEWSHPNMPWDGTFLLVCDLTDEFGIRNATLVSGGMDESIFQPSWNAEGVLHYVSDRSGWWNIYRQGETEPVVAMDADFGGPQWGFAQSRYAFLPTGDIACYYTRRATDTVAVIRDGRVRDIDTPFVWVAQLTTDGDSILCVGASPTETMSLVSIDPASRQMDVIRRTREPMDPAYISVAEAIEFESEGRTSNAFFFAPHNVDHEGTPGEKPPLLVFIHGGPTGMTNSSLNLLVQFWASRGFAVVDVNYGGSAGFGREYRRLLNGNWGVVDLEDCVNAARFLASRGDVDPERLAIRGGSAGGYTTLCALTFSDVFKAGANYYGVTDFTPFVEDTHKFESRYLDSLVGPYPERKDLYYERSPANFVDRITVPVITFQGLEDPIVPPSQSELIVNALRAKGIPCAYVTYEGEQHGFRRAENIIHSLESELYFYSRVFGFEPDDEVEPITIENL